MTEEEKILAAVAQLVRSDRGYQAMAGMLPWLNDQAAGLDRQNQAAVAILIEATWGPLRGTALQAIYTAVNDSAAADDFPASPVVPRPMPTELPAGYDPELDHPPSPMETPDDFHNLPEDL